jgi:hypothetical protein
VDDLDLRLARPAEGYAQALVPGLAFVRLRAALQHILGGHQAHEASRPRLHDRENEQMPRCHAFSDGAQRFMLVGNNRGRLSDSCYKYIV